MLGLVALFSFQNCSKPKAIKLTDSVTNSEKNDNLENNESSRGGEITDYSSYYYYNSTLSNPTNTNNNISATNTTPNTSATPNSNAALASLKCTLQRQANGDYLFDGTIIPSSLDQGKLGFYFITAKTANKTYALRLDWDGMIDASQSLSNTVDKKMFVFLKSNIINLSNVNNYWHDAIYDKIPRSLDEKTARTTDASKIETWSNGHLGFTNLYSGGDVQTFIKFTLAAELISSAINGAELTLAYSLGGNDANTLSSKIVKSQSCGHLQAIDTSTNSNVVTQTYVQGKKQAVPINFRIEYDNQISNGQKLYHVRFDYEGYNTNIYTYPSDLVLNCTGQAALTRPVYFDAAAAATIFSNWVGYYLPAGVSNSAINCSLSWSGGSLNTSKIIP